MAIITIRYCFKPGKDSGSQEEVIFTLEFDDRRLELVGNVPAFLPEWAKLEFCQCTHCPLDSRQHPYCLVAVQLVNIVNRFDTLLSYNETYLEVITKERKISQETTIQRALGSLMGLVIATCGCPHTIYFKPMARFHLPLANNPETIYRAASMYLLAQYFLKKEGKPVDWDLKGLDHIYNNIQVVNYTIAERLRAATKSDSVLNALVELDIHAQTLTLVIEDSLQDLRPIFDPYFKEIPTPL